MHILKAQTVLSNVISKIIALSLLLTTDLVAMENVSPDGETPSQIFVTENSGTYSLSRTEVKDRALDVHIQFPFHHLLNSDDLADQIRDLNADGDRLENHQLTQIIDHGCPLAELTPTQSMNRAWRELEMRIKSSRRDRNEKAGYMLGLAKLLMTSGFEVPDRFERPLDCYNFVLSHLHYVIDSPSGISPRKVTHAYIWKALMLTKLNLTIMDHTREETLHLAWNLLEEAYKRRGTYSTLVFQIELIVRYGLRPHNMSQEEAFTLAQQLYKKINNREHQKACKSLLDRPLKRPFLDKTWHVARAAFLKNVSEELKQLKSEFHHILIDVAEKIEDDSDISIEDHHQSPGASKLIDTPVADESPQPNMPEALRLVNNLIQPLTPEMVRAFDPRTGGYMFFNEYDVSGFMNSCFFNCTGLTRESALQSLLDHSGDHHVRQLVAPQILSYMINHLALPDFFRARTRVIRLAQLGYESHTPSAETRYTQEKTKALKFCETEDAYRTFVSYALSEARMMDYQRTDMDSSFTSIVDALAHIHHFNLVIWTASDMDGMINDEAIPTTLQRVHWYNPLGATRNVHLHHLRQETDGINHFKILLPAHQPSMDTLDIESGTSTTETVTGSERSVTGEKGRKRLHESTSEDSETEVGETSMDIDHDDSSSEESESDDEFDKNLTKSKTRDSSTLGQEIYHYYTEGKTKETIAGILKITSDDVADILEKEYGIKKTPYVSLLSKTQKNQLRQYFKINTQLSPKRVKMIADKVGCTPDQVRRFFKRETVGLPDPLENNHKKAIQVLAFNKKRERNTLTNQEIANQLEKKFERRFEAYQVMNYIRTLYRSTEFNPRTS